MKKYCDPVYEDVRQALGYDENDDSVDGEIDSLRRCLVLNYIAQWNGLLDYGYTFRYWVYDVFGVDLDALVGEADATAGPINKRGKKYSESTYQQVRQNLDYEMTDETHDAEIDTMEPTEVFTRLCEWNGLLGWSETILEWVDNVYETNLYGEYVDTW